MSTPPKKIKQVIALITFEDPEEYIENLSAAALWIEASLKKGPGELVEVTTFISAEVAATAELERSGDFAIDGERLLSH